MTQRRRTVGAVVALLLLSIILSGCASTPLAQDWPGLTVAGGRLYVTSGSPQKIYMLNPETGVQERVFGPQPEPKGTFYWSPVRVEGDLTFVGLGVPEAKTYGLYAFDPNTAVEQWHVQAQDLILAAPVYEDGSVYFGASDGQVYAVDVETRSIKPGWPFRAEQAIWGSPLVADGRVYVASMDHHLYCLDPATGKPVWAFEAKGAMAAQPTLDATRGVLYIGDFDGQVYAIQADSGKAVEGFEFRAKNWIWSEVLLSDQRLYVTSLDGNLYALDPATGSVLPPYPLNLSTLNGGKVLRTAPVQAGELIVVTSQEGYVTAVNGQTGMKQWQWPGTVPAGQILTTPVVSEGKVYVAVMVTGQPGTVYALAADTGVQAPGNWPSPPLSQ